MTSSQYSMAEVKLGTKSFSVDSEVIDASNSKVLAADCVAFCARLSAGDFKRLRVLKLVSVFLLFLLVFGLRVFCCCEESGRLTCAVQYNNGIGDSGVSSIASSIKDNTTLTVLTLVSSWFSLALLVHLHVFGLLFYGFCGRVRVLQCDFHSAFSRAFVQHCGSRICVAGRQPWCRGN